MHIPITFSVTCVLSMAASNVPVRRLTQEQMFQMRVVDLKDLLRGASLRTTGVKVELIARLFEFQESVELSIASTIRSPRPARQNELVHQESPHVST